ncbi:Putative ribonuclease H protein [Apostasia shenzhenica]|uniref:Ribonuclease H protein n=1 Tax=Apostasia shenzhenica TaxID=1088818 RepID=A0A2I0B8C4_9ASPA|nr:Putative ribonuclease H protein [Apostasia shenzhenica]
MMDVRIEGNFEKYLGLPPMVGRAKKRSFANLKSRLESRLESRIEGWKEKLLSTGGKEILLKSVAQAIPTFAMSVFRIPSTLCNELEQIMARFWWQSSTKSKGIHWSKWHEVCLPKNDGGLGFKSLNSFNLALLGKQVWRLSQNQNSLSFLVLRSRYFPSGNFLEARLGFSPSYIWQSIWQAKNVISKGLMWRVGNERRINIWHDKWIPRRWEFKIFTQPKFLPKEAIVNLIINPTSKSWDNETLHQAFDIADIKEILCIPLGDINAPDTRIWAFNPSGSYSVRSGYHFIQQLRSHTSLHIPGEQTTYRTVSSSTSTPHGSWKNIWNLQVPSKVRLFTWRLLKNFIPSFSNLCNRRMIDCIPHCLICGKEPENSAHIFGNCPIAATVWSLAHIAPPTLSLGNMEEFHWVSLSWIETGRKLV